MNELNGSKRRTGRPPLPQRPIVRSLRVPPDLDARLPHDWRRVVVAMLTAIYG